MPHVFTTSYLDDMYCTTRRQFIEHTIDLGENILSLIQGLCYLLGGIGKMKHS